MKHISVKLMRSRIGCSPIQLANLNGLGLKNRLQVRELEDTPAVRGMIAKVCHLVQIIEQAPIAA